MNIYRYTKEQLESHLAKLAVKIDYEIESTAALTKKYIITQCDDIITKCTDKTYNFASDAYSVIQAYDIITDSIVDIRVNSITLRTYDYVSECLVDNCAVLQEMSDVSTGEKISTFSAPEIYTPHEIVMYDIQIDYDMYCKYLKDQAVVMRQQIEDGLWSGLNINNKVLETLNLSRNQLLQHNEDPEKYPLDMGPYREWWMNMIREYRLKALEILDIEQKAAESDADADTIDEIDMVKQMLRDIPQDIDLSMYTNLKDLMTYWPPLLLPRPKPREIFGYQILNNQNKKLTDWGVFGDTDDEYYKSEQS